MENRPFDMNAWDYDKPRPRRGAPMGGKAIGLTLCQKLADGNPRFYVPKWFGMNENAESLADNHLGISLWLSEYHPWSVIVRSSGRDEDWFDGRSGVERSVRCRTDEVSIKAALRERVATNRLPVVVQSMADGYGCVVDVGWSHLLGKAVVRVARGGTSNEGGGTRFTSATWDNEATFGLYDAETGEAIIALADGELDVAMPDFARELVAGLRRIGVTYGVQLEVVIHPKYPFTWKLVQLRPSPSAMRGTTETPPRNGRLLMTSCRVSKPGTCEGESIVMGDRDKDREIEMDACAIAREDGTEREHWFDDHPHRHALAGKIVLWSDSSVPKSEQSVLRALGAALTGAVGQISLRPLVNSSHGTKTDPNSWHGGQITAARTAKAKEASLLIGAPRAHGSPFGQWPRDAWPRTPVRLRIVSDGLVGEIYQLD